MRNFYFDVAVCSLNLNESSREAESRLRKYAEMKRVG